MVDFMFTATWKLRWDEQNIMPQTQVCSFVPRSRHEGSPLTNFCRSFCFSGNRFFSILAELRSSFRSRRPRARWAPTEWIRKPSRLRHWITMFFVRKLLRNIQLIFPHNLSFPLRMKTLLSCLPYRTRLRETTGQMAFFQRLPTPRVAAHRSYTSLSISPRPRLLRRLPLELAERGARSRITKQIRTFPLFIHHSMLPVVAQAVKVSLI